MRGLFSTVIVIAVAMGVICGCTSEKSDVSVVAPDGTGSVAEREEPSFGIADEHAVENPENAIADISVEEPDDIESEASDTDPEENEQVTEPIHKEPYRSYYYEFLKNDFYNDDDASYKFQLVGDENTEEQILIVETSYDHIYMDNFDVYQFHDGSVELANSFCQGTSGAAGTWFDCVYLQNSNLFYQSTHIGNLSLPYWDDGVELYGYVEGKWTCIFNGSASEEPKDGDWDKEMKRRSEVDEDDWDLDNYMVTVYKIWDGDTSEEVSEEEYFSKLEQLIDPSEQTDPLEQGIPLLDYGTWITRDEMFELLYKKAGEPIDESGIEYKTWQEAYLDAIDHFENEIDILQQEDGMEDSSEASNIYGLIYVDDDNTPELVMGNQFYGGGGIYWFHNNKLNYSDAIGIFPKFIQCFYYPKNGYIFLQGVDGAGANQWYKFYKLENGEMEELAAFSAKYDYKEEKVIYEVDDQEISYDEFLMFFENKGKYEISGNQDVTMLDYVDIFPNMTLEEITQFLSE